VLYTTVTYKVTLRAVARQGAALLRLQREREEFHERHGPERRAWELLHALLGHGRALVVRVG
jgi:hypothetical protein